MRQPDEKGALVADVFEQVRFAGDFDENFLKQVARVVFIAGEIEEEGEKRWRVRVIKLLDLGSALFLTTMTRRKGKFV